MTRPKFSYIIILGAALIFFTMISFLFFPTFSASDKEDAIRFIYKKWKVEKLYRNGEAEDHLGDIYLNIKKDGTAEWIRRGKAFPINFRITPDQRHFVLEDPHALENLETIFELKENKIRFGKKNKYTNYEYVLVPAESK